MHEQAVFIKHCKRLYRDTLLNDIVPFWMRHGIDREYGGISNVIDDAGHALNHDKFLWSQGRALWTFSALYNRVEQRDEWLQFADHIFAYLSTHGRDEQGRWVYRLDQDGNLLDPNISIYVDGFVMLGMAEYYAATKNADALRLALETYENVNARLHQPGSYGTSPYEIPPGMKVHGVAMIFSFFFYELGKIANRPDIRTAGIEQALEVLNDFYQPEKGAILEFVGMDGSFVDTPQGRTCVPGHAIEAMWFLITIFERENDPARIATCCQLIRRHLELAWDAETGGLMLGFDIDGKEPVYWNNATYKPWWTQAEAMVATAYAYRHTGEAWCLDWHRKVQEWAFARYPVPTGEWTQWLDKQGNRTASSALPVKDPFHLPRALIYLCDLFNSFDAA